MSEEKETRKIYDTKNGAQLDVYGAASVRVQSRVEYGIPLPWPQDRPPDDKFFGSPIRDETRFAEEHRTDRDKFGVEYDIPPMAARPPP